MFGNVAHKADRSGGLSNPLCRNSLCFPRAATPLLFRWPSGSSRQHKSTPVCLYVFHCWASIIWWPAHASPPPSCLMMSSLCGPWPLTHPSTLISPQLTPILHSQTWTGVCIHERPLFSLIKYVVLVLDADRSVMKLWNGTRAFKLFDDKYP